MMNKLRLFFLNLLVIGLILSCKMNQVPIAQVNEIDSTAVIESDSVFTPETEEFELEFYRGERTRHFKLSHTKLEVSFDWERQWMFGKVLMILEPYFYQQSNHPQHLFFRHLFSL